MTVPSLIHSRAFKDLVRQRWWVSGLLLGALFLLYYGFLMLIATQKPLITQPLWGSTPLGIPLGAAVIVLSWLLTAVYVVWANQAYDPVVKQFMQQLNEEEP